MGELVGHECAAEYPQALAPGSDFERTIVDIPDQLGGDEDGHAKFESREPAHAAENPICPVVPLEWDSMTLHERARQRRMTLLFAAEQLNDTDEWGGIVRPCEPLGRPQQSAALGLLPELKCRDGPCDQKPGRWPRSMQPRGSAPRMTSSRSLTMLAVADL